MDRSSLTAFLAFLPALASCLPAGAGLGDPSKAAKIKLCETNYKEIIALYRAPRSHEITITADAVAWNMSDLVGSGVADGRISVRFNKENVVVDYVVNPGQGQTLSNRCEGSKAAGPEATPSAPPPK